MREHDELDEAHAGESSRDGISTFDGSRVLWGRVVALIFLIGWAFVLGRCSAPGGVPREELRRVNQELADTQARLQRLQERRESPSPSPSPQATTSPSPTTSPTPTERTHVVRSGDTLRGISLRYYGTTAFADLISETNNVEADSLRVGQELRIPPRPQGQ